MEQISEIGTVVKPAFSNIRKAGIRLIGVFE